MAVKGVRLVLRKHADFEVTGVNQVAQHEVDESVATAERNGGLCAVSCKGKEPLPLAACQDNGKNGRLVSHTSNL